MYKLKSFVIILLLTIAAIAGAQDVLFPLCYRYPASESLNNRYYNQLISASNKYVNDGNTRGLKNCIKEISDIAYMQSPAEDAIMENLKGIACYYEGDMQTALSHYLKSLELFSDQYQNIEIGLIHNNVAIIFASVGDFESSKKYIHKALELSHANNGSNIGMYTSNLAESEAKMGNHQKAIDIITDYFTDNNETSLSGLGAGLAGSLVNSYNKLNNPDKSEEWIRVGYSYMNPETFYYDKLVFFTSVMEYHLLKDENEAVISLWDSVGLQDEPLIPDMYDHLNLLAVANTRLGDFEEAWRYEDMIQSQHEKKNKVDNEELISILLLEFDSERNQRIKQSLEKELYHNNEKEKASSFLLIALIIISFSLLILLYFLFQLRKKRIKYRDQLSDETKRFIIANDELQKTNKTLEEENNLLDTMISVFAHDLINPFQAILGFSRLMVSDYDILKKDDFIEYSSLLCDTSFQLKQLLTNLQNMSLIQDGKEKISFEEFDIQSPVEEVVNLYQPLAKKKKIDIVTNHGSGLRTIMNMNILQSIIRNTLSNAIKFSKENENIIITSYSEKNRIIISVEDKGAGISEEVRQKLLKKEYLISKPGTADEKGSGLGLSICIELLELCNGSLDIMINEFGGTTVEINIGTNEA